MSWCNAFEMDIHFTIDLWASLKSMFVMISFGILEWIVVQPIYLDLWTTIFLWNFVKHSLCLKHIKKSGRMWYNPLSQFLLKQGYKNDPICPCVFIKWSGCDFVLIVVYVDDLNIIGIPNEISKVVQCLTKKFEMKGLGKTKFCLGQLIWKMEYLSINKHIQKMCWSNFTWINYIHWVPNWLWDRLT